MSKFGSDNMHVYIFLFVLVGVCHGTILQHPAAINGYLLSTGCAASSWDQSHLKETRGESTQVQSGSNMTGTVYTVVYTQIIPVIFEPPCN